jgi:hypothetical protein
MRPTTSNIFQTSLAFHPSSLSTRTSMRVGTRGVGSKRCSSTGSCNETTGMEASSCGVVGPELWRIS